NAPPLRVPSVALVLAQVEDGGDRDLYWLSIPLSGSDTRVIETKPGSKVEATVAGHMVGPVAAAEKGNVRLPMGVPPAVRQAALDAPVRAGEGARRSFWRLGRQGPWSYSAGIVGGLGRSFDGANAGGVLAEVAVRIESSPLEALLDFGGTFLSEVDQYTAAPAL